MTSPHHSADSDTDTSHAAAALGVVMWRRRVMQFGTPALAALAWALWQSRGLAARLEPRDLALLAAIVVLLAFVVLGVFMVAVVVPTVSRPADSLADLAEAVADGDLTREVTLRGRGGIRRLSAAVERMLGELRTLALALRDSSSETAALAAEITTGATHMASAAQEMAATSSELSAQATEMASTIQHMAGDATQLVGIAEELSAGAQEGVTRNVQLRALAGENRTRLDDSLRSLETLAAEVETSAANIEALAQASEEIRAFVTFVQKMARQSKLLALNAAMEAARAGEQGQGFAVVATEVRRLAAGAADAAERTEALVKGVLAGVDDSRASTGRAVETVQAVLGATQEVQRSFLQVESAVGESEGWTARIDSAATQSRGLVLSTTKGLEELARGTESFAAAMEQVAASSQEQSASTEEIAAAASALANASTRLASLVGTFRVAADTAEKAPEDDQVAPVEPESAPRPTLELMRGAA